MSFSGVRRRWRSSGAGGGGSDCVEEVARWWQFVRSRWLRVAQRRSGGDGSLCGRDAGRRWCRIALAMGGAETRVALWCDLAN